MLELSVGSGCVRNFQLRISIMQLQMFLNEYPDEVKEVRKYPIQVVDVCFGTISSTKVA